MNTKRIFDECSQELSEIVPKLAGRLVATGEVDRYKHILLAAKAFRDAVDEGAKTASPGAENESCSGNHQSERIDADFLGNEDAAKKMLAHCDAITNALDAIVSASVFSDARKRTAAVYRSLAENIEEPIFVAFPHL
jgi:hypothetical protein